MSDSQDDHNNSSKSEESNNDDVVEKDSTGDEENQSSAPADDEPADDEPADDEVDDDKPAEDEPAGLAETTEELLEEPLSLSAPAGANNEPENEFETFASKDAPWVGAEQDWIEKKDSNAPESVFKKETPLTSAAKLDKSEDEGNYDDEEDSVNLLTEGLTKDDLMAVIASIPPPPPGLSLGTKLGIVAIIIAVLGIASGTVLWIYTEMQVERDREINKMQAERDRERIAMRLESNKQILDLQKQIDSAKNRETEQNLKAQLEQAKAQAAQLAIQENVTNNEEEEKKEEVEEEWEIEARKRRHQRRAEEESATLESAANSIANDNAAEVGEPSEVVAKAPVAPSPSEVPKDNISDLLDKAVPPPSDAPSPTVNSLPKAVGGLMPLAPSREQVKSSMDSVAGRIKGCGNGTGGRIVLKLAVSGPTGRVISAEPHTPEYVGTPVGICASRAVRLARFPKFQKTHLVIKYPFDL